MRIGDKVFFASNFTILDLLTASPSDVVSAFARRINEYYLSPAELLNKNKMAFGSGTLCFTAIDAIAKYELGGGSKKRFKKWISKLQDFRDLKWEYIERVYDEFRNGLVHEGRVKNGGQFTYDIDKAIEIKDEIIFINPEILLQQIRNGFGEYIDYLKRDEHQTQLFNDKIKRDFEQDIEKVRSSD